VAEKKAQQRVTDESVSAFRRYQDMVVGSRKLGTFLKYEFATFLFGNLGGALGLVARQKIYPTLFDQSGRKPVFGSGTRVRCPSKIRIGDSVVVSDGAVLDGRSRSDVGMELGDRCIVGHRALLLCKDGRISIGKDVGIGAYSGLYAVGTNTLTIGNDCLIGPYTYFGGTRYHFDKLDVPMREQGHDLRGGIVVGDDCWFGAGVQVMDGVTIGRGSVIASGAVVTQDVDEFSVVGGVPARLIRRRG
jgi:acetyltransferase-like isoleucine patch superfamily enzyme